APTFHYRNDLKSHAFRQQTNPLVPSCEVDTFRKTVVVDQFRIRFFGPSLRRLVDFLSKHTHGDQNLDAPDIEEAAGRKMAGVPVEMKPVHPRLSSAD